MGDVIRDYRKLVLIHFHMSAPENQKSLFYVPRNDAALILKTSQDHPPQHHKKDTPARRAPKTLLLNNCTLNIDIPPAI